MKTILLTSFTAALLLPVCAQEPAPPADAKPATSAPAPAKRKTFTYAAPKSAAVNTRVDGDGGSRGGTEKLPNIFVLAPKHVALTSHEQPALFWFQTGPTTAGFD